MSDGIGRWYVTFGQKYPREDHPAFSLAHHDGWVTIIASGAEDAREHAIRILSIYWADIYPDGTDWRKTEHMFPLGEIARFTSPLALEVLHG